MKIRVCALALISAAVVVGSPVFASAQAMDAKAISCAAFLAMSDGEKTVAITDMHAASPDAATPLDDTANADAVASTTQACQAASDMTAYDAMTTQ